MVSSKASVIKAEYLRGALHLNLLRHSPDDIHELLVRYRVGDVCKAWQCQQDISKGETPAPLPQLWSGLQLRMKLNSMLSWDWLQKDAPSLTQRSEA